MAVRRPVALVLCAFVFLVPAVSLAYAKESKSDDLQCLATAIYFEARGEPETGQRAVGRVVVNRAESGVYPDSICGVVYQGSKRRGACQFSFACDGASDKASDESAWEKAEDVAGELLACDPPCQKEPKWRGALWTSTHYHADYVHPAWAKKLKRTGAIGRHVFYAGA